jgi:hypothetical protein
LVVFENCWPAQERQVRSVVAVLLTATYCPGEHTVKFIQMVSVVKLPGMANWVPAQYSVWHTTDERVLAKLVKGL